MNTAEAIKSAQELADEAEGNGNDIGWIKPRLDAILSALSASAEQQPVALTDEQIADIAASMEASDPTDRFWVEFVRKVESELLSATGASKSADSALEPLVRKTIEEFKQALWATPNFGDKINKATRNALHIAHNTILNLPAMMDQALAQSQEQQAPVQKEMKVCGTCNGRGKRDIAHGETAPCPNCRGTGLVGGVSNTAPAQTGEQQ